MAKSEYKPGRSVDLNYVVEFVALYDRAIADHLVKWFNPANEDRRAVAPTGPEEVLISRLHSKRKHGDRFAVVTDLAPLPIPPRPERAIPDWWKNPEPATEEEPVTEEDSPKEAPSG